MMKNIIKKDDIDKLDNHQIIKRYFLKTNEDFDKLIEKTTGFTKLPYDKNLFDQVKKISEVMKHAFPKNLPEELKRITEATKAFSGETPAGLAKMFETAKNAVDMYPFDKLSKNTDDENSQVYPTPIIPRHYELEALFEIKENFNSLLKIFNSYNEYSKDMQKVTNTIISNIKDNLEFQIKANEKTSKTAFIVSIIALILSALVFVVQIFISTDSNKYIDKLNFTIEQLSSTYIELNTTRLNNSENIENLNDKMILHNENKVDEIKDD